MIWVHSCSECIKEIKKSWIMGTKCICSQVLINTLNWSILSRRQINTWAASQSTLIESDIQPTLYQQLVDSRQSVGWLICINGQSMAYLQNFSWLSVMDCPNQIKFISLFFCLDFFFLNKNKLREYWLPTGCPQRRWWVLIEGWSRVSVNTQPWMPLVVTHDL